MLNKENSLIFYIWKYMHYYQFNRKKWDVLWYLDDSLLLMEFRLFCPDTEMENKCVPFKVYSSDEVKTPGLARNQNLSYGVPWCAEHEGRHSLALLVQVNKVVHQIYYEF